MSIDKPSLIENLKKSKPALVTVAGIILIYLLALRTGAAFVFFGLISPDTCWLLKLGGAIAGQGAIPKADPFSFTLPLAASLGQPQPFVVYQWLSEIAFFEVYRTFTFTGLLVAAAILTAYAYLVFPLRACARLNAPMIWSFLAVAAASTASNLRSFIRPEIFSCLYLSIWFWLLTPLRAQSLDDSQLGTADGIDWRTIGLLSAVMLIWCNMHTGFVAGIIILAIYAVSSWISDCQAARKPGKLTKTLLIGLLMSTLASMINPYGIGLWLYLPHLFFAPVNEGVFELRPVGVSELSDPLRFPLVCLVGLCYGAAALNFARHRQELFDCLKPGARLSSLLILVSATVLCFCKRRLVNLCSIMVLFETALLIGRKREESTWPARFWRKPVSLLVLELMILILVPRGVHDLAGNYQTRLIPQPSAGFEPPMEAMVFFTRKYDGGRIFASMEISDMLDLYFSPKNSIFMDTRLDAFSDQIIKDYNKICWAHENWKELLDQYQIKWVFARPSEGISQALEKNPAWDLSYKDSWARLFRRKDSPGSTVH